jgi:hypothetical protein
MNIFFSIWPMNPIAEFEAGEAIVRDLLYSLYLGRREAIDQPGDHPPSVHCRLNMAVSRGAHFEIEILDEITADDRDLPDSPFDKKLIFCCACRIISRAAILPHPLVEDCKT